MAEDVWSAITREVYSPASSVKKGKGAEESDGALPEAGEAGDATNARQAANAIQSYALCVGMPGAGKSSLLNAYLNPNKDETPKPTVALEYMFARRATAANAPKDIAHVWELGGGLHVSDLVKVPITTENFQSALYMVVVDLSKPSSVIPQLLHWTDQIKACVKVCVRELSKADPTFAEGLKRKTYAKFGHDHPDLRIVKPCPVPLVLVANKYDVLKNQESMRRRVLGRALRFIAHVNGATLLFCSTREKQLRDIFRLTLNKHLFHTAGKRIVETNPERPLIVPAGADSFESILKGIPSNTRYTDFVAGNSVAEGAMDVWKQAVVDVFGPGAPEDAPVKPTDEDGDQGEDEKNPCREPVVDEARAQRDEVLRRYQKEAERRAKLERRDMDSAMRAGVGGTRAGGGGTPTAGSAPTRSSRASRK